MNDGVNITDWRWEENKLFENNLVTYPEECNDRWERIAACLPGKTVADIKEHYEKLLVDIGNIESGEVALPDFPPLAEDSNLPPEALPDFPPLAGDSNVPATDAGNLKKCKNTGSRQTGKFWTEDEHRKFLVGLQVYRQGDWKSIARYCVRTRSATQVASHAQKYFTRLNSLNKDRRRSSIHDITTFDDQYYNGPDSSGTDIIHYSDIWTPQDPNSSESLGPTPFYVNSGQQSSQLLSGPPLVSTSGTGIEHHIDVTPLNLGLPHYMAYGMQVAAPETADPGAVLDVAIPGGNHTIHPYFQSTSNFT